MDTEGSPKGTIAFRLFGIPIYITPFTWLLLAILGGGFGMRSANDLKDLVLFVVIGMVTLIVHELGHALAGRAFTGGTPVIVMAGLGGATYQEKRPEKGWQYFLMVLAGPLATLLPGMVAAVVLGLRIGHVADAHQLYLFGLPFIDYDLPYSLRWDFATSGVTEIELAAYGLAMAISFVWGVFNLLPMFPLDGGRLLGTLINNERVASGIGLVLALAFAVWSLAEGVWFNVLLGGYLAYINFNFLRATGAGARRE